MQALSVADLERLIEIMRNMHVVATDSNWQELARLDSERRALLKFDSAQVMSITHNETSNELSGIPQATKHTKNNPAQDSYWQALVTQIVSLDKEIIHTVQSQRRRLLDENRGLSAQTRAKNEYAQTSSMT